MLNLDAVKAEEQKIKSRSGGKNFTSLKKDETKDIRILDPTPAMNGLYWVEVPIWWINSKPLVSPEFIGEEDYVQKVIDEYEEIFSQGKTPEEKEKGRLQFKKLLDASKGEGMKLISKSTAFWIPILEFAWELEGNAIMGVVDAKGEYDTALIKKFVKDGRAKIFDVKQSLLSSINQQMTTGRFGTIYVTQEKGFNMRVSRAGTGRDTKYTAITDMQMPMPENFYGKDGIDVHKIAKAEICTIGYIDAVLAGYFEGKPVPENAEYRFPELRSKDEEPKEETSSRSRRRDAVESEKTTVNEPQESAAPTRETAKPEGEVKPTDKEAPTRSRNRDLVKDVAASEG